MSPDRQRLTLALDGLVYGGGGALTIERALTQLPGVVRVYVNPATEMAYIEHDPNRCDRAEIVAAIARAGFRASDLTRG